MTLKTGCAILPLMLLLGGCSGEVRDRTDSPATPLITGVVETGGAKLYYEEQGSGEPLVLIHSARTNLHMWDGQFEALAGRYRTIRYDGRGFGRSQSELVGFTDYDDLLAVMDRLGIEKAILVGLSLGGMTAIEFTLEHPERVRALALAGTGLNGYEYKFSEETLALIAATRQAAEKGDLEKAATLITEGAFDAPERPWTAVDPALREKVRGMVLQSVNRSALEAKGLHHFLEPAAIGRVREIAVPLLVILGEYESPNEYGIAEILERSIPNVRRTIIPGSKHLTAMENPEAFNQALAGFLRGL